MDTSLKTKTAVPPHVRSFPDPRPFQSSRPQDSCGTTSHRGIDSSCLGKTVRSCLTCIHRVLCEGRGKSGGEDEIGERLCSAAAASGSERCTLAALAISRAHPIAHDRYSPISSRADFVLKRCNLRRGDSTPIRCRGSESRRLRCADRDSRPRSRALTSGSRAPRPATSRRRSSTSTAGWRCPAELSPLLFISLLHRVIFERVGMDVLRATMNELEKKPAMANCALDGEGRLM